MREHRACPYPGLAPPVDVHLTTLPAHDCAYLPGRTATSRAFLIDELSSELYHDFMDAGFRRSGKIIYQPICAGCRACLPIRVLVDRFAPTKSQRRCLRKNADLVVSESYPRSSDEKFELYCRYTRERHDAVVDDLPRDRKSFESFLYESPVNSIEFNYRNSNNKLLAVGICDLSSRSLSSVYYYYDPGETCRGLGTFGVLNELAWARKAGVPLYYLGYWVKGCRSMEYKDKFHPHQILSPEGKWDDEETLI